LDIDLDKLDEVLSPSEFKFNSMIKPEYLPAYEDVDKTLLGVGAGLGSAYMLKKALPEQTVRHFANQSMNFLEGFYKPGITQSGKLSLYGKEALKATGRMAKMAANPYEAIAYANTGVSPLIKSKIGSMEAELKAIDNAFLKGDYGKIAYHKKGEKKGMIDAQRGAVKKVKQLKNKLIKERHYKILNDAANREIFGGKISKILTEYRQRKPHLKNYWDYDKVGNQFRKLTSSDDVAEYVVSRQSKGLPWKKQRLSMWSVDKMGKKITNPNLRYIKWLDNNISGVLRGAQFNYPTYEALSALKTGNMGKMEAFDYLRKKGFNPDIIGKKIVFNFSPAIKSNFDWGGYNAVAEWDYSKKGKVILHATDLRDTPLSSTFKGKNVLNYVQSKPISIKSIKEHTDMSTKPNFVEPKEYKKSQNTKLKPIDALEKKTRGELVKAGTLEPGGQIKTVRKDVHTVLDKANKAKTNVKLRQVLKSGAKGRNILKYLKYAGKGLSAAGLAALAFELLND
tara:strand:+ start:11659 stop:13185 length:1527 start_codon:yes stop_codon:yes gene_type:complete